MKLLMETHSVLSGVVAINDSTKLPTKSLFPFTLHA